MPIYTKKGDKGETGLFSENEEKIRISKDSLQIEAIGAVDELNSYLGVATSFCANPETRIFIEKIQTNLFTINSIMAGANLKFSKTQTTLLEKAIDKIDKKIPKLTTFVLPFGSRFATHLMYARAMARRAERRVVALGKFKKVRPNILQYLNRLSDMIFTLFREANFEADIKDIPWKGRG